MVANTILCELPVLSTGGKNTYKTQIPFNIWIWIEVPSFPLAVGDDVDTLEGSHMDAFPNSLPPAPWTEEAIGFWRTGRIFLYLTDLFFSGAQRDSCHDSQLCASCRWSKRCPPVSVKVFYPVDDSLLKDGNLFAKEDPLIQ